MDSVRIIPLGGLGEVGKNMTVYECGGDVEGSRQIDAELGPAYELLKVVTNPIAIKAALNLLGHDVGGLRLPLVEATEEEREQVRGCLERLGLLASVAA